MNWRFLNPLILPLGCFELLLFAQSSLSSSQSGAGTPQYVGSTACKTCHPQIYERWKKTRMANVVVDPKEHPEVILADFSKPDPLVHFTKDEIAFFREERHRLVGHALSS
jgi:hypothetical protein